VTELSDAIGFGVINRTGRIVCAGIVDDEVKVALAIGALVSI